jgi:signal transduction histidine kinase
MFKLKRATQFTLYSTGLMTSAMAVMYVMLVAETITTVVEYVPGLGVGAFISPQHIVVLIISAIAAFFISSVVIENALNPVRQMILKVREVGEMNFGSPLVIDEEDDELREYAFTFNTMSAKLDRYIEMQKRFVSDASHELATPITIINGHADMLLRRAELHDDMTKESLATIKQEITRMDALVDSLLALARSDSGGQTYSFEPANITSIIEESIKESRLLAPSFSFEVNLREIPPVVCDDLAIRRVMRILLSNAIKYTANDNPQIKITAEAITHGTLIISVADNGIGIPQSHLPRIFERFYRVDPSRNRKTGSSGLGLAIAAEIVHAHKGKIEARSTEGEGTEITFAIPS